MSSLAGGNDHHDSNAATDRQVARAAIRVVLRRLGIEGEREVEAEIEKVVAEEAEHDATK